MSVLEGRGLVLRRGGRLLLDAVAITLEPGSFMALIGPNGAGKSSLMGLLSGTLQPDAGELRFAGRPLARWRPDELARRRAVLRQHAEMGFAFTAREVVELGRSPHRGHGGARLDGEAVSTAMAMTGTTALAARAWPTLSGGERQRVQIARILAQLLGGEESLEGRCLLLDEPTAALDMRHQQDLPALARRLAARGCAVLAILHDFAQAARADRLMVLEGGRAVACGAPSQVLDAALARMVFGVELGWVEGPAGQRIPVVGEGLAAGQSLRIVA